MSSVSTNALKLLSRSAGRVGNRAFSNVPRMTSSLVSRNIAFPSPAKDETRREFSIQRLGTDANPNMSSAVVHGGILTTMGVIDTEGKTVEEQTQNILDKIDALLTEGGTDRSKLLTANIWLKDIGADFGKMNAIWVKWIQADNKPIRACVEANLAFPSLLVEIQVTAAV